MRFRPSAVLGGTAPAAAFGCLLTLLAGTAVAAPGVHAQVDEGRFRAILGQATTDVNQTINIELEGGKLTGISGREQIEWPDAYGGAWRIVLTGWRVDDAVGGVTVFHSPAIVVNKVGRLEYHFLAPEVPGPLFDRVMEKTADLREDIETEHDNVAVSWGREGDQLVLSAEYVYNHGDGQIQDRLHFLMMRSRELIMDVAEAMKDAEGDAIDDLRDSRPTALSVDDFELLVDDGLASAREEPSAKGPDGLWTWTHDERHNYEIYISGPKITLETWRRTAESHSEDVRALLVERMTAWADEKKRDAAEVTVRWDPSYPRVLTVTSTLTLDGTLRGNDVRDWYRWFTGGFSRDAGDEITDLDSEVVEEAREALAAGPMTRIGWAEFERLVDDDLEGLWEQHPDAAEGWWEFDFNDVAYELFAHGDAIELTFYVDGSALDDAALDAAVARLAERVAGDPADGATSMTVLRYPGYEHLVWVRARYELDGSFDGEELKRRYTDFMYEYSPRMAEAAADELGG